MTGQDARPPVTVVEPFRSIAPAAIGHATA